MHSEQLKNVKTEKNCLGCDQILWLWPVYKTLLFCLLCDLAPTAAEFPMLLILTGRGSIISVLSDDYFFVRL